MNTLTLKIPQALDEALQIASRRRQISKSAVVRDALERTLSVELKQLGPAAAWLERWRGAVSPPIDGELSGVSPDRRDLSAVSPDRRDLSAVSPDRQDLSAVSPAPPDSRLAHILAKHMH